MANEIEAAPGAAFDGQGIDFATEPAVASAPERRAVRSICGVCPAGCGVTVHLRDERIERLTPLKSHPCGIVCPRGARAGDIVHSKDRLLYPRRRIGERGDGRYERITWDQAFELWVDQLQRIAKEFGPEAIALYTGRGNFEFALNEFFSPNGTSESSANAVLFPFGSPNAVGIGSLCYAAHGMIAPEALFGAHLRDLYEDIDGADLILVWGANPATDSPPINLRRIKQAKGREVPVIVIDHRRNETARALDAEWIGVRPGTDGALALGMIAVLIEEDLFDRPFVEQWTHGFDDLRAYVRTFTPERVEATTGVPARRVRTLARQIAAASGCSFVMYTGLEYSNSGVQAVRAAWTLQALAGHLDVVGGKLFRMPDRLRLHRPTVDPPAKGRPPLGAEEYPLYYEARHEAHATLLPRAILEGTPYPIRSMIISGASVITAWPDPGLWRRALQALDFLVVINRFPTADSQFADLILPATTMFEIESYMIHDGHVQLRSQVLEPLGEARNDYLIFAELARRLGYGHLWPQTESAMVELAVAESGISIRDLRRHPEGIAFEIPKRRHRKYRTGGLRADGQPGFETPTGKFEIASEWFRGHGYEPLPVYTEPTEGPLSTPELAERYPLVLNTGARTQTAFRSQHHNIPSLVARQPRPWVHMHRRDAEARGIADGDEVLVISPRGKVRYWARVSGDVVEGVVEANMGGGGPLGPMEWREANVNELTDMDNRDPISGFPVFKALLCDVVRATHNDEKRPTG
ncbi:MAG: molybdopterin-dependent oxidoreductase [Alphaproteobacteria bacterium]|jgi:anaerobic selenocysteine-containing dehydrogenase|nr:molybdopterin-dependent oxidoreductase [Alphaproteobacteria bacterium]MDP6814419.1 molybdopterin-dependent oxidoreductase [Alphaproteobacteria bacterium]